MMSIKTVNALSHYTDWTIGHALRRTGLVCMVSIGALYHLIPRLGKTEMYSTSLINTHWLATIGTVLYIVSMWVNGITQGLMWQATNADGTLQYSFINLARPAAMASPRLVGGAFFVVGMLIMLYNVWQTIKVAKPEELKPRRRWRKGKGHVQSRNGRKKQTLIVLIVLASASGDWRNRTTVQYQADHEPVAGLKPHTALELEGRDVYLKEGCVGCHSQMVRPCGRKLSVTATTPR